MFRKILNCFAIACAVSTLPYAVGVLRADPEGNCRRQCANYKCFVTLSPTDGKIAACMDTPTCSVTTPRTTTVIRTSAASEVVASRGWRMAKTSPSCCGNVT